MRTCTVALAAASLLLVIMGNSAFAQNKIGLKFVGGGQNGVTAATLKATDQAGVTAVAQKNWNVLPGTDAPSVALKTDDGSATKATVTYKCAITWSASADATKGADYALMDGYLDSTDDGATPTVTVAAIPYAVYDVYVYFNGDGPEQHRHGTYTIGVQSIDVTDGAAFAGMYTKAEKSSTGNYVLFSGVKGSTFTLNTAATASDGSKRCVINAIQIVKSAK